MCKSVGVPARQFSTYSQSDNEAMLSPSGSYAGNAVGKALQAWVCHSQVGQVNADRNSDGICIKAQLMMGRQRACNQTFLRRGLHSTLSCPVLPRDVLCASDKGIWPLIT